VRGEAERNPAVELPLVVFEARGFRCGVEARIVDSQSIIEPEEEMLTAEAFFSLCDEGAADSIRSGLLAVGARDASSAPTPRCVRRSITLALADGLVRLAVSGPVELATFQARDLHPLPALVEARCAASALRGFALEGESPILLFDPRAAALRAY